MRLIAFLLTFFFLFQSSLLADCPPLGESWNYVATTNKCVRLWDDGGDFKSSEECMESREGVIKYTWGIYHHTQYVHLYGDRLNDFFNKNAAEGKVFGSYHSIKGINIYSTGYEENEIGTYGYSIPATKEQIEAAMKHPARGRKSRDSYWLATSDSHGKPIIDNRKDYYYDKLIWWTSSRKPSVAVEDIEIKLQQCHRNNHYWWHSYWSMWRTDSYSEESCNDISTNHFLVLKEYQGCIGGVCPTIDPNNEAKPKCEPPAPPPPPPPPQSLPKCGDSASNFFPSISAKNLEGAWIEGNKIYAIYSDSARDYQYRLSYPAIRDEKSIFIASVARNSPESLLWRKLLSEIVECPEICSLSCLSLINNIFPFDIFSIPGNFSVACPLIYFFGYPWDLCFVYELVRLLKYPILISLSIKVLLNL